MSQELLELPREPVSIVGASLNHPVVRQCMPGMSLRDERLGCAVRVSVEQFGAGRLWCLREPGQLAFTMNRARADMGALMLQVSGTTTIAVDGREAVTQPGQLRIVRSNWRSVEIRCHGDNAKVLLELPWRALAARHPLLSESERIYSSDAPGVRLVSDLLLSAARDMHSLGRTQKEVLAGVLVQAAGLPQAGQQGRAQGDRRVANVMTLIDAGLQEPDLCAAALAHSQRLSRRRLDQLFMQEVGVSVASYISGKRLERARELLLDRRHTKATITEIAFAVGFADSAHFSRAFRVRFGLTPSAARARSNPHCTS